MCRDRVIALMSAMDSQQKTTQVFGRKVVTQGSYER